MTNATNLKKPFEDLNTAIVVDLDGTIVMTDTLHEACVHSLLHTPTRLLHALPRITRPTAFKATMGAHFDVGALPVNRDLLDWLETERSKGRRIVLATAAGQDVALEAAKAFGPFDAVLHSDDTTNLKGTAKRDAILEHLQGQPFVYVGDSNADKAVWQAAAGLGLSCVTGHIRKWAQQQDKPTREFGGGVSKSCWREGVAGARAAA